MKKFFTLSIFFLAAFGVFAQGTVTGTIVDAESQEPLIGASVLVKGTLTGTITDFDGTFALNLEEGEQTLVFTYTGYNEMEQVVSVSGKTDVGTVELGFSSVGLDEIEVIASVAVDRKTPVAVSTITGPEIEAKVGNQEYPEMLRKTPGVYVTKQGGGFGDSRINVRGFDQRNTAVMINGIPVNDMENGWVYWSNWAGLADVTSRIQVQRGLGASKLAVASVGGSINIITNAADMDQGGTASVTIGNDGYQKYGVSYNTGLSEKGWAFSLQGTHTQGDGYVEGTQFRAWSYFASLSKIFNPEHSISLTVLGAPQWHHQRNEPGRFDGVTLRTFVDPDDPNNDDPTTGRGIKYNWLWGELDGEEFSWRRNFYHKPKAFVNHYWNISDKTELKTSAYFSLGLGGGTGPRGRIRGTNADGDSKSIFDSDFRLRDADGHVRFDDIVAYNQGKLDVTAFDAGLTGEKDIDPTYGPYATSGNNGFIRRASMNYHTWYGLLSTLTTKLSNNLTLVGGLDARYYKGEHFRRVEHLLGNDAYLSTSDDNNPMNYITETAPADFGTFYEDGYKNSNNVLNYYNDGLVSWLGLFAQLEYSTDKLSTFLSLSGSNQGFKRIDYFNYLDSDPAQESDWENHMGGTAKIGANYNIDERNNVFVNGGYFSRQPIFDNVYINFRNDVNEDVENQSVVAFEAGYGYRSRYFSAKLNGYYTEWGNRQFDETVTNDNDEDVLFIYEGVSQVHTGIELELDANPVRNLNLTAMLSLGNWEYKDDFTATGTNLDTQEPAGERTVAASGLKIGDAAQTTFAVGANYQIISGLRIYADYFFADNLYAEWDIQDGIPDEVVELPSYGLMDAGISYSLNLQGVGVTFRVNVNNVLDEEYISEMSTNIVDDPTTEINEFYNNRGVFGFGRTWNTGLKINF
ncbi:MAG: TonB-dependent receptor [Chitinophagales bacterium]|nr:TonB-dependent receptor [Chitinophagales bacterium]